jgi:hypothetical protein
MRPPTGLHIFLGILYLSLIVVWAAIGNAYFTAFWIVLTVFVLIVAPQTDDVPWSERPVWVRITEPTLLVVCIALALTTVFSMMAE